MALTESGTEAPKKERWLFQWKELHEEVITSGLCTGCAGCVISCPHDVIGYDHVLSIEMECEYIDVEEGLNKSVEFLKPLVLEKPPGSKWWELAGMERAGGLGRTGAEIET